MDRESESEISMIHHLDLTIAVVSLSGIQFTTRENDVIRIQYDNGEDAEFSYETESVADAPWLKLKKALAKNERETVKNQKRRPPDLSPIPCPDLRPIPCDEHGNYLDAFSKRYSTAGT